MPLDGLAREPAASGVMMLPIPHAGVLRDGRRRRTTARAVPGITGLEITVPRGRRVRAAARKVTATSASCSRGRRRRPTVEAALRAAHDALAIRIDT